MTARKGLLFRCLSVATVAGLAAVPAAVGQGALIIDHTCTDLSQIPPVWIDAAKALTFHYAHTSHGSQVVSGALNLESLDSFYSIAVRESGTEGLPPVEDPPAFRMYDGNPPETYIEPGDYWDSEAGRNRTRAVAATGNYDYSMWSWCGQVSSASEAYIQAYLAVMSQFETEFPGMRFILMTGHTDGSRETGNLNVRNNQIRAYALANDMVLFDFADIESYDPDGNYYLPLGCNDNGDYDGGNWCTQWCAAHPGDPLCDSCSCAHSQSLICNLKGRAFWWMMARLAGWPGPGPVVCPGDADCDGDRDFDDIKYFVVSLGGEAAWVQYHIDNAGGPPTCSFASCDANGVDGVTFEDIKPFAALIGVPCP